MGGCSVRNKVDKDRYLLNGIAIDKKTPYEDDLLILSKQKPNRKILGVFRYNLWLYQRSQKFGYIRARERKIEATDLKLRKLKSKISQFDPEKDKDSFKHYSKQIDKFERKLESQLRKFEEFKNGLEPPVYLDTLVIATSTFQMQKYLFDKGYFNNKVTYKVKYQEGRKMAKVTYQLDLKNKYYFRTVRFINYDKRIDSILLFDTSITKIEKRKEYNVNTINNERLRIENVLQNQGYYLFKQSFIKFKVDTTDIAGDSADVKIVIDNPSPTKKHTVFYIDTVMVTNELRTRKLNKELNYQNDTDVVKYNGIYYKGIQKQMKPEILSDFIFIKPNVPFQRLDKRNTETRLNQIRNVKFVDISFQMDTITDPNRGKLNTSIKLTQKEKNTFTGELEINRTEETDRAITNYVSNYYGLSGSVALINRNLAKRALQFDTRLRGTVELHFDSLRIGNVLQNNANYQIGLINSLIFPQVLVPWKLLKRIVPIYVYDVERLRRFNSQTSINLNTLFERNTFFERTTGNLNYTYQFQKGKHKYFFTPLEISLISATPAKGFVIPADPLIQNLFDRHIITDGRFTKLFNNQPITTVDYKYSFRRTSFEIGGLMPRLYDNIIESKALNRNENGNFIIGNRYFNYIKVELDYRLYLPAGKNKNVAFRLATGVGAPLLGSNILPYEKRFYVGGANSIRGWRSRDLGPGTFTPKAGESTDKSGDFKIEGSIEYRFPIYSFLKGALFTDFGNVWVSKRDTLRPGAKFGIDQFYKEFAISAGPGLRFDFSFFVIRFDVGWRIHNPAYAAGDRWYYQNRRDVRLDRGNLNIGIGYPF